MNYPKDLKAKGDFILVDPVPDYEAPKGIVLLSESDYMKQQIFKPEGQIVAVGSEAEKKGFKIGQKIYFEDNRKRLFWLSGKLYGIIKAEYVELVLPDDYILQYAGDVAVNKESKIVQPNGISLVAN